MHWCKVGLGIFGILVLVGCSDSRQYASGVRAGADTALQEVAAQHRAAQQRTLLADGALPSACGTTGQQTQYGTVHVRGGFGNGMWTPPHDVVVVYSGPVVQRPCP